MKKYDHSSIEKKWQKKWSEEGVYSPDITKTKKKDKFYNLWMFPYPSAEGVHVGTIFSSTGSDIYGRFMRMQGCDVFQPMGYDSFGIHSENFALKIGEPPSKFTKRAVKNYERQFKEIGHGYDWTRTVTTSDVDYYKWTQWLFVQMYKAGLAYKKTAPVNYCPSCKTVLADEQIFTPAAAGKWPKKYATLEDVPEGVRVCERCGNEPEKRELSQWFFRITDYAQRLLDGLEKIDWSEIVTTAQRNWIGKKEGITISYPIKETGQSVSCFTTRPDTNFGATFVVVSPEYARDNLLNFVAKKDKQKVSKYIEDSLKKTEQQRKEEGKSKTGVFTGLYAINQLNNYEMPIWVSDFVLAGFGTGAVVGVPGHDRRDFEFAKEFDIPIVRVVKALDGDESEITELHQVQEEEGVMINSEFLDGMDVHRATKKVMDHLEKKSWGKRETTYHLRDWLISRQRYWGPPIPMIYCDKCAKEGKGWLSSKEAKLIEFRISNFEFRNPDDWSSAGWYPEENLPVELPDIADYEPKGDGQGPLASHPEFYEVACPECGGDARRETDVSDTFLDSSWYFLRYPNVDLPNSEGRSFDPKTTKTWLPVDLYFGGAEHSVLHLMYARFVWMALKDMGHLPDTLGWEEPFPRFFAHGLMIKDGSKMSKSRGNVVNPDEYIAKYGADTLRLYLMFMGPMDGYPDFRDTGIEGMRRFVDRVWGLFEQSSVISHQSSDLDIRMHQTIKKVTEDIERFRYNTAIAAIMEYVNELRSFSSKQSAVSSKYLETLALLIAPFAPHLAEEVWQSVLGKFESIHTAKWPEFDKDKVKSDTIEIPVQVDGKLRSTVMVDLTKSQDKDFVMSLAREDQKLSKWIKNNIQKEIFVPGKLVNFVTGQEQGEK